MTFLGGVLPKDSQGLGVTPGNTHVSWPVLGHGTAGGPAVLETTRATWQCLVASWALSHDAQEPLGTHMVMLWTPCVVQD